ncbi:phosphatase PAP2 family protein [Nannocystis pusilla]|uniref:Phosphatase PAP2 family protein n=1 Tax=Nannocystis pusilla TaxID=889268 RepID=A0ABS7U569_9BACT|nr:phosphatase PAP2 family protein [Nannocystis pusilla]
MLVAGGWSFVELADEVVEGETAAFDRAVLLMFRAPDDLSDPRGPPWLEAAMRDLTALGGSAVVTLVTLTIFGYLALSRRLRAIGLLVALVGGGALLARLLKQAFARPRPSVVPHLLGVESASFPSSHATMAAVVYLSLGVVLARLVDEPRLRAFIIGVALAIALVVGVSRVYAGVHYPSDVLAGWVLGVSWAVLCWLGARLLPVRWRA